MRARRLGDLRETFGRIEREEADQGLSKKGFRIWAVVFDRKMRRNADLLR